MFTVRAPGPFAERDVDAKVLHRRVHELLDRLGQPMDFVDEQDRAFLGVGEIGQQVLRGGEGGAAGDLQRRRPGRAGCTWRTSSCRGRAGRRAGCGPAAPCVCWRRRRRSPAARPLCAGRPSRSCAAAGGRSRRRGAWRSRLAATVVVAAELGQVCRRRGSVRGAWAPVYQIDRGRSSGAICRRRTTPSDFSCERRRTNCHATTATAYDTSCRLRRRSRLGSGRALLVDPVQEIGQGGVVGRRRRVVVPAVVDFVELLHPAGRRRRTAAGPARSARLRRCCRGTGTAGPCTSGCGFTEL